MKQHQAVLQIRTRGRGMSEITSEVDAVVADSGIATGVCHLFVQHTSASVVIQENADPSARRDIESYFERIAPEDDPEYLHTTEGPDDMPAHLRTVLTSVSEQVPVSGGRLQLGTWQGIYLFEHRRRSATRRLIVHLMGD